MLVLLGKSIGASKYTILSFKFVKKSGSEIYDNKNVLHRRVINSELIFFFLQKLYFHLSHHSILLKFFCSLFLLLCVRFLAYKA